MRNGSTAQPPEPPDFALDEPPTLPNRSHSGRLIKARVIRAMEQQHEASKLAHKALDELVRTLRRVFDSGSLPPSAPDVVEGQHHAG